MGANALVYRLYTRVRVCGTIFKALIEEEFGDGIMSAINFDMSIARKDDRITITMSGKFLSCRTN